MVFFPSLAIALSRILTLKHCQEMRTCGCSSYAIMLAYVHWAIANTETKSLYAYVCAFFITFQWAKVKRSSPIMYTANTYQCIFQYTQQKVTYLYSTGMLRKHSGTTYSSQLNIHYYRCFTARYIFVYKPYSDDAFSLYYKMPTE